MRRGMGVSRLLRAAVALCLLAGPARAADPLEAFNRANFAGSRRFEVLLKPIVRIWRALTPGAIGEGIHNLLGNLHGPVVVANDLLQLRIAKAGEAAARFAWNSTLGVAGLVDVAGAHGNPQQENGFADTLGRWGVGPGPYLFLPVLGPTTPRDLFGTVVDAASNPIHWWRFPYNTDANVGLTVVGGLDTIATGQEQLDAALAEAADAYATLRSLYLQSRQAEIDAIRGRSPELPPLPDLSPEVAPPPAAAEPTPAPAQSAEPEAGSSAAIQAPAAPPPQANLDLPIATARA
jgi:phospholipid-binding lipoprotein MlaA